MVGYLKYSDKFFFEEVILGESKKALYLMEDNIKTRMFDYQKWNCFQLAVRPTYDLIYKKPNLSHI